MLLAGIVVASIHLIAVLVVVGGSFFINFILSKATGKLSSPEAGNLNHAVGEAFGKVAWISTILIAATGLARAAALGVLNPSGLLDSAYGNLMTAKIVLLIVIIFHMVGITRAGLRITALSGTEGAPDTEAINVEQKRIKTLSVTTLILSILAVVFAVAMRFIGAP